MADNKTLNKAKYSQDTDEWYTTYETIEKEIVYYEKQFRGKIVLCNCDDPFESNFAYYFLRNFNRLQLKKLICTSYCGSKISTIHETNQIQLELVDEEGKPILPEHGYVMQVSKIPSEKGQIISDAVISETLKKKGIIKRLKGNGDFRSEECIDFLKKADIVCTNPPFSLFADLFSLLVKYDKHFLLIGNQNAITYKEIFPYIKANKAWVGYHFGDMAFKVPADSEPRKTRFWIDETGQKWRSLGNAMWLTNLDIPKRHNTLQLTEKYDSSKYLKYDNFNGINVPRVADIPSDYYGVMGVPITYLKYHNERQFEIVGEANHGSDNEYDLFKPMINGKELFKRILIKRVNAAQSYISEFRILDLFCGAGGLSYGLEKNPHFKTAVALDAVDNLAQTFKKNMPDTAVIVGDIRDANIKSKIIELSKAAKVNMIVGGPPCQGYSMKGKKLGLNDPRNFLFREYLGFVKDLQPDVFVIENVRSLLSTSKGWFKEEILRAIEELGYNPQVGILKASDFGVPQTRERVIFICAKNAVINLPVATVEKAVTVREAISDLAYLESGEGSFEQEYITEPVSAYQRLMREGSRKLYNHKASNHAQIAIEKLKMIPPEKGKEYLPESMIGKQQFRSTWGRLKWDEPSPTIDTRFDAASNGTNNHPELNRAITPREAARLQSFDDRFVFYGAKVHIRVQIGNAVPPLMAKAIADQIYRTIGAKGEEE